MRSKNGFTVVELIVSFALTMTIAAFLFQIIISLKNLYVSSGTKTELLTRQALMTDQINRSFDAKKVSGVTKCGDVCLIITYLDGSTDELKFDQASMTLAFGDYKTVLSAGSKLGVMEVRKEIITADDSNKNNGIFVLHLPISNPLFQNADFGVHVIYQYSTYTSDIVIA